jgi:DNA-nicking Smr family endonuclease
LQDAFEEAIDKKIKEVEIIPGKGSGQLKKKVQLFLQMPHIKPLYHRIENDSKNFGRLFVYFKF